MYQTPDQLQGQDYDLEDCAIHQSHAEVKASTRQAKSETRRLKSPTIKRRAKFKKDLAERSEREKARATARSVRRRLRKALKCDGVDEVMLLESRWRLND